jgi:hypothetical protein
VARLDLLLSRIDEVLATKFEGSARGWCKAADLSLSYIGALRNRGGAKGTGEVTGVKYDEVAALARAAGVKVTWLMGDDTLPSAEDGRPTSPQRTLPKSSVARAQRRRQPRTICP